MDAIGIADGRTLLDVCNTNSFMTEEPPPSSATAIDFGASLKLGTTIGHVHGRIKVFVRPRQFDALALKERGGIAINVGGEEQDEITIDDERGKSSSFGFDRVFQLAADNAAIFEEVGRPLVASVLCGYNATLMAYGQTGSGKTHSLGASDGLVSQMLSHLFRTIDENAEASLYRVSLSYVQVYNEKCFDLLHLSDGSSERALPIRETKAGGVFLEGVSEHRTAGLRESLDLLSFGRKRLHFAETRMNRHSSRSHAVCLVKVERTVGRVASTEPESSSKPEPTMPEPTKAAQAPAEGEGGGALGLNALVRADEEAEQQAAASLALSQALNATVSGEVAVSARLTLVDLAGSERVKRTAASGATLHEAQKINLSLLELGNCIQALSEQSAAGAAGLAGATAAGAAAGGAPAGGLKHVPFRNSTLTRLLQESLGGNCKTSLLVRGPGDLQPFSDHLLPALLARALSL